MKGTQHLTQEFKYAVAEDGTFDGLLATYGNVDLGGDSIEPGAFAKTLAENGNVVPLLWQHDSRQPCGNLTISDSPEGLRVKGTIDTDTPVGDYAYKMIKRKRIGGLSIGYDTVKSNWEGSVRKLKELRLWEGSIVTFPMDTHALISSVKAARERKDDFNTLLSEQQLNWAGYQMMSALQDSLGQLLYSRLAKPEMLAMAQTIIQQFNDAYMSWLPDYIDYAASTYGGPELMGRAVSERKEGREISASNKKKLKTAHEHLVSAAELIQPLSNEEAGSTDDTTSDAKAGRKSKPDDVHLAARLEQLRSLVRSA